MKFFRILILCASVSVLSSCANVVNVQPQVNGLTIAGRYDQALKVLSDPTQYGTNNQLLFYLDKGMVLHMAGRYKESTDAFEAAKLEYERLYTQSISKISASWLWNDYALPYRGEDFERVILNIFEAMNFAVVGDIEEALVEARDVDSILNAINQQYDDKHKNVYRDDAFAQMLMGMLYEADGNLNDALICYRRAWKVYQRDYKSQYNVNAPLILKENLLAAAEEFGDFDLPQYRRDFADIKAMPWAEKKKKGEIVIIEYAGLAPLKLPVQIPIPLPGGFLTQITFPKYEKRGEALALSNVTVAGEGTQYSSSTEVGEDIEAIAIKNLNDRKIRVMAKAVLRPAGKYLLESGLQYSVEKDHGEDAAVAVSIAGSLYNMASERADLRSWQTLPAQIRVARALVDPGEYEITTGSQNLGSVKLSAGEKKFLLVRTLR